MSHRIIRQCAGICESLNVIRMFFLYQELNSLIKLVIYIYGLFQNLRHIVYFDVTLTYHYNYFKTKK